MSLRTVFICCVVALAVFANGEKERKGLAALSFKAAYTGGRLSDAFSSIFYAGDGVVLAGKRSNTPGNRIFRSTDYGRSWTTTPEPDGYSGRHVYFFDKNNDTNVIITGTGDTGTPCLLRSTDMGKTWTVVLSSDIAAQLAGCDPGAIFSPLSLGNRRWIACFRNVNKKSHIIESLDDGLNWHNLPTNGLSAGCRRMILTSYGQLMCGGVFGDHDSDRALYISNDKGYNWIPVIKNWYAFAGMAELPGGVLLAGSVSVLSMKTKITSVKRTSNTVYVTLKDKLTGIKTGSCVGIASMSDSSMNVHPCVQVTVQDNYHFSYPNSGPDVAGHSENSAVFLPENPCTIYRSTDRGTTWSLVANATGYSLLTYVREIRYLGNGLVYAFVAGNENEWDDRSLEVYRSADSGASWERVKDDIYVGQYGRLNSVYQTALTDKQILVAATQPDSDIIIHEGPFA